jgi:hypothetical protein
VHAHEGAYVNLPISRGIDDWWTNGLTPRAPLMVALGEAVCEAAIGGDTELARGAIEALTRVLEGASAGNRANPRRCSRPLAITVRAEVWRATGLLFYRSPAR